MLGVPTSPCWVVPGAGDVPVTSPTSSWARLITFNASQVPCSGGVLPSSLFLSLVALPVPETERCSARAPFGSCLQATQPCKVALEALCTIQVSLSDQQDLE